MTPTISSRFIFAVGLAAALCSLSAAFFAPVFAQANDGSAVQVAYDSGYSVATADVTRPITVQAENHLYHPGERIAVKGSVWSEVVDRVESLNVIKVEVKNGAGDVVAMSDTTLNRNDGSYTTALKLPDNAPGGTYSVESKIELEADALGIVKAITSATLQSSIKIAVAQAQSHQVSLDNQTYSVSIASNSALDGFEFKQQDKAVSIFAEGESGTTGVMEMTIPKNMLSGEMAVFIDDSLAPKDQVVLKANTETETTFEINYTHSIHKIAVTGTNVAPEFPLGAPAIAAIMASAILIAARLKLKGGIGGGLPS